MCTGSHLLHFNRLWSLSITKQEHLVILRSIKRIPKHAKRAHAKWTSLQELQERDSSKQTYKHLKFEAVSLFSAPSPGLPLPIHSIHSKQNCSTAKKFLPEAFSPSCGAGAAFSAFSCKILCFPNRVSQHTSRSLQTKQYQWSVINEQKRVPFQRAASWHLHFQFHLCGGHADLEGNNPNIMFCLSEMEHGVWEIGYFIFQFQKILQVLQKWSFCSFYGECFACPSSCQEPIIST